VFLPVFHSLFPSCPFTFFPYSNPLYLVSIQDQWEILPEAEKSKSGDKSEKETSIVEDKTTTNDDNVIVNQPGKLYSCGVQNSFARYTCLYINTLCCITNII
jgi:hypothetical protein